LNPFTEDRSKLKKTPTRRDAIAVFARGEAARRSVGENNKCECGESRPEALVRGSNPIVCYECFQSKRGLSTFEKHHPAASANNPATIPVRSNDHRAVLSPLQYDWPQETLRNKERSPLLAVAANLRGYNETSDYLKSTLLQANPEFLEALETFLQEQFGPNWWYGSPLEKFAPRCNRK
jgi:hypothetical protein